MDEITVRPATPEERAQHPYIPAHATVLVVDGPDDDEQWVGWPLSDEEE